MRHVSGGRQMSELCAEVHSNETELARQIVFSSDDLAPGIDDRTGFSAWREFVGRACGPLEVSRTLDRPFSQRMEEMRFQGI
jgi:hypothetical protein